MNQHTPGPWVAKIDNPLTDKVVNVYPEKNQRCGYEVAVIFGSGTSADAFRADASLIAAAPDMLAALEELVDIAEQRGYHPDWLINAHAAIAKAKGAE